MRALYGLTLDFEPTTNADEVLDVAASWLAQGRAPLEIRNSWEPGQRRYELSGQQSVAVDVLESDEGRLWRAEWRQPHFHARGAELLSSVEIGATDQALALTFRVSAEWVDGRVAPPAFPFAPPRLPATLVARFEARDAGRRLLAAPTALRAADVDRFVDELLLNPERRRPVLFLSEDPRHLRPSVDPAVVARSVAGLAHVYYAAYGGPAAALTRRLPELGARGGAFRLWWPGLSATDSSHKHPLWTLDRMHGRPQDALERAVFRRVIEAGAMAHTPDLHRRLRRAGLRHSALKASDVERAELLELALEDNAALVEANRRLTEESQSALFELELVRDELENQTAALARAQINVQELSAAHGSTSATSAEVEEADPVPTTVLEAVEIAAERAQGLAFAPRAFESAKDSPFQDPLAVLEDLLTLDGIAQRWARPEGIGGMDLGEAARQAGLQWRNDIGNQARSNREYHFSHDGEQHRLGPHLCLGSGSGAGKIARIYFTKLEPEDPTERRLLIGHVGRKLSDSTT